MEMDTTEDAASPGAKMLEDVLTDLRSAGICEWDGIADRLEAAWKREREAMSAVGNAAAMREVLNRVHDYLGELIRDNLVEDTPRASDLADDVYDAIHGSHPTAEKTSAVGNAAAMREALKNLTRFAESDIRQLEYLAKRAIDNDIYGGGILQALCGAIRDGKAALSAPPRNCDLYNSGDAEKDANSAWDCFNGALNLDIQNLSERECAMLKEFMSAFVWLFSPVKKGADDEQK